MGDYFMACRAVVRDIIGGRYFMSNAKYFLYTMDHLNESTEVGNPPN